MTPSAPSPHAAYGRFLGRRRRWGAWWRRFGRIVFYVIATVLAAAFAFLLVAGIIDLGQPRIWGTFTQTDCEPRPRHGCRPVGTWVSEDRTLVKRDVYLDGSTDSVGTTRASYQPTAIFSDEVNNVVHTPVFTGIGPWLMGGLLLWWVGFTFYKAVGWGDIKLPPPPAARVVPSALDRPRGACTGSRSRTLRERNHGSTRESAPAPAPPRTFDRPGPEAAAPAARAPSSLARRAHDEGPACRVIPRESGPSWWR